ncbi:MULTISPECIES: IS1634 family transposase, partial [Terrabacteria group]|uniref:IS1634 family transposase n=1 Tax=Bacillati TaxID=1783272 RepID=UPI001C6E243C
MFITKSKSKNSTFYYLAYSKRTGKKVSTHIFEALGSADDIRKKVGDPNLDVDTWTKAYAKQKTLEMKEDKERITVSFAPANRINHKTIRHVHIGYFFIQKILKDCGLTKISDKIKKEGQFKFDLNQIMRYLVASRILAPGSKLSTFEFSKHFFEAPNFALHDVYRTLEKMYEYKDFIQESLYQTTHNNFKRNSSILYYDCTNYFFEIEEEKGIRQYGLSKEHRPNPIVQMGLFLDQYGLPLAFDIFQGNKNEQASLKPIEQKIIKDYGLDKVIICCDAGLNSCTNKKFNDITNRGFIMTYSLKKAKQVIKDWVFEDSGWKRDGDGKVFRLSEIKELENDYHIYYKERWIKENGVEERIIVSYSPEYAGYQEHLRSKQIIRAEAVISSNKKLRNHQKATDFKRLIAIDYTNEDGVSAKEQHLSLNSEKIAEESKWDGLYCISTNLEDNIKIILQVHRQRWKIEESFRILKSEFKARPVYLSRESRIYSHFLTCFMALLVERIIEKNLVQYTTKEIITTLRSMQLCEIGNKQYIPAYTRTVITDKLHDVFKFNTDYEIMSFKSLNEINKKTKS